MPRTVHKLQACCCAIGEAEAWTALVTGVKPQLKLGVRWTPGGLDLYYQVPLLRRAAVSGRLGGGEWPHLCSPVTRHTSHRSEPPGRSPRHASRSKLLKREPVPFPDTCHISQGRERPTAAWIVHWGMSQSRWHVNDKKLPCHLPFTRQRGSPASVRRCLPY